MRIFGIADGKIDRNDLWLWKPFDLDLNATGKPDHVEIRASIRPSVGIRAELTPMVEIGGAP